MPVLYKNVRRGSPRHTVPSRPNLEVLGISSSTCNAIVFRDKAGWWKFEPKKSVKVNLKAPKLDMFDINPPLFAAYVNLPSLSCWDKHIVSHTLVYPSLSIRQT